MKLTPSQLRVLTFIVRFTLDKGYPPTLREICRSIGATSTYAAHCFVVKLISLGLLRKEPKVSRGLTVTVEGHAVVGLIGEEQAMRRALG